MAEVQYHPLKEQNGDWELPMMCAGRNRLVSALAVLPKTGNLAALCASTKKHCVPRGVRTC